MYSIFFNFYCWQETLNDNAQTSLYICIWSNVKFKKKKKTEKNPPRYYTLAYNSTNQNDSTVFDQFK